MIRVGIIGAGGIARTHASNLQQMTGVQIAAIADPDRDRAETLATQCGATAHVRFETLLDNVDAVYVCSPPRMHRVQVEAAAAAGKHVYCEKPIAATVDDGRAIAAALSTNPVRSMVGYNNRFRPAFQRWRDAARNGEFGAPLTAWIQRMSPSTPPPHANWRTTPGQLCGVTIESASHDIDLIRWAFGEVSLVAGAVATSLPELEGFDDSLNAVLQVSEGPSVTLTVDWSSALSMSSRCFVGTEGAICMSGPDMWTVTDLRRARLGEVETVERIDHNEGADLGYRAASEHFIDCILEGRDPEPTIDDGLAALNVSEALRSAAAFGVAIPLHTSLDSTSQ